MIIWDSAPDEPTIGYTYLACEKGITKCEDQPITTSFADGNVLVRVGRDTKMTAVISNDTWAVLQDCNGGSITDAKIKNSYN